MKGFHGSFIRPVNDVKTSRGRAAGVLEVSRESKQR
jgi:hypothetical protein